MSVRFPQLRLIQQRLADERGTLRKRGGLRVALLYPSPYHVGMSSLGFQTIYRVINTQSAHTAERAFLPDDAESDAGGIVTYESLWPLGDADVIAVSLAYELEVVGLIDCLERAGLAPLAADRRPSDPLVVLGGPITFSNSLPAAPFADVVVMGEAEGAIVEVLDRVAASPDRRRLLEELADRPGLHVPSLHGEVLRPILKADDALLPAYSQIITPHTELAGMHLVEAERGCHRRCTFCVMRRSTNGGMRTAPVARILETIPEHATRVGLVGAAVTDHPELVPLVRAIVEDRGLGLGISSLRADRLTPELVGLLRQGGYRTLTVASDAASQRLRDGMEKSIKHRHMRHAARLTAAAGIPTMKVYMMLGVPGETDADIDELVEETRDLSRIVSLAMTISPFVAKKNTPLDGLPFAGVDVVERRIKDFRHRAGAFCDVRSTSARWAWVEHCLAQGGFEMARAALDARAGGGRFADWKGAVERHAPALLEGLRRDRRGGRGPTRVRGRHSDGRPDPAPVPSCDGLDDPLPRPVPS